jgi:Calcineurin-like phosphoesterase.
MQFIRVFLFVLFLSAICACNKEPVPKPEPQPVEDVRYGSGSVVGRVLADGKALSGVVVSDGFVVDTTDLFGCFSLDSKKEHGYVFISIPDGFNVPTEGVIPGFFSHVGRFPQDTVLFNLSIDGRKEYTMFVLGDIHLANKRRDLQQFDAFVKDIGGLMDDSCFAVTLGDMSWDAYWDGFDLQDYLFKVNADLKPMQVFHTIGNHDHDLSKDGDWETALLYKQIVGPTYYSFNRGGVHFIVLDDIICTNQDGKRSSYNKVSQEQIDWLKKDLGFVDESMPLAIFMHAPLYRDDGRLSLSSAMDLINCLRGHQDITFFSGHTHTVYNVDVTKVAGYVPIYENCCGAVCGAWWYMCYDFPQENVHIGSDGAPGGYKVVTVKDGKLSWYFKAIGKDAGYQFRTYDRNTICLDESYVSKAGSAAKAAFLSSVGSLGKKDDGNLIYINVWDYDPQWSVVAEEDGRRLEVRRLEDFKDPMYLSSMEAFCFNNGYTAEYTAGVLSATYPASTTNHIFSVKASRPDSTIEITVTDRFGRQYKESMSRPKRLKLEY